MASKKLISFFQKNLFDWAAKNPREMPWKGEKNPYLIWLSEIILQQTRVEQGLPYFEKFKLKYPTVKQLADAPEDEVMKMWEGLGYYSRARNLHFSAKLISNELGGIFPTDFESISRVNTIRQSWISGQLNAFQLIRIAKFAHFKNIVLLSQKMKFRTFR